jgi:hypothetical protein
LKLNNVTFFAIGQLGIANNLFRFTSILIQIQILIKLTFLLPFPNSNRKWASKISKIPTSRSTTFSKQYFYDDFTSGFRKKVHFRFEFGNGSRKVNFISI